MKKFISPGLCFLGTGVGIVMIITRLSFLDPVYTLIVLIACSLSQNFFKLCSIFLKILLPISIPLFILHTFINPIFPFDYIFFNVIPVKLQGIQFSLQILRQLALFISLSLLWLKICPKRLLNFAISNHFPLIISLIFGQAISIVGIIERKSLSVYIAQQARGINTGGGGKKLKTRKYKRKGYKKTYRRRK